MKVREIYTLGNEGAELLYFAALSLKVYDFSGQTDP